jgi:ABC-2 type transport system permease protein
MNLASAMEYKVSFLTQVITMFINNAIYFVFWIIFFNNVEQIGGWGLGDMMTLFAIVTTGFGLALTFFGNSSRLALLIEQGQIDYYLVLPRNTMVHILSSRTSISAIGDIAFGVSMFIVAGNYSFYSITLWLICAILVASIAVAYMAIVGSMAFWLGRASILSEQAINALLTFSMYPSKIFEGVVRIILLTIIPAGFISAIPVRIITELDNTLLIYLVAFSFIIITASIFMFLRGLKRYESGNLININM